MKRIWNRRVMVWGGIFSASLYFAAGCRKPSSMTPAGTSTEESGSTPQQRYEERVRGLQSSTLSTESKKSLMKPLEELRYSEEQEILDRKELIEPAAADFRPEAAKRKIRLILTLEKRILRRGEKPRFRLDVMNIGQEPIAFSEIEQSFFKTCDLSANDHLSFRITPPDGRQEGLAPPFRAGDELVMDEIKFPAGWTDDQKAQWVRQKNLRNKAAGGLHITIRPGENLRTRGDAPGDLFCALRTGTNLKGPGTYKLQVEFDDTPAFPSERIMRDMEKRGISRESMQRSHERALKAALGRAASNVVAFEMAP